MVLRSQYLSLSISHDRHVPFRVVAIDKELGDTDS